MTSPIADSAAVLKLPVSPTDELRSRITGISGRLAKRGIDILLSIPVVVILLPPLAVLVYGIHKRQSPGPLFFRQKRCGLRNQPFVIFKFRTMNVPADPADATAAPEDRVFPLGRILRDTKLDEIPQFVNVLLGTMSVVGPRPHHFSDCETFSEAVGDYSQRTITKPGITGLAQYAEYRGDFAWNCTESRVQKDLDYIRDWSILLDLQLIAKTANVILQKSVATVWRKRRTQGPTEVPALKIVEGSDRSAHLNDASHDEQQKAA